MITALHLLALAVYLTAWAAQFRAFRRGEDPEAASGSGLLVSGAGIHAAGLAAFTLRHDLLPLLGLGPASSSLALLIALFALAASRAYGVRSVGLLALPMVILLLGEATWVGIRPATHQTAFRGAWFAVHVGTAFVGYAGLALGSVAAVMYVLQFRALKRKQFGSVFGFFPSLDALDRVNRVGLGVGFPALTLGMVVGWAWTLTYGQGLDFGNPQVTLGVVTWVAYSGALAARLPRGWRGRRAAGASTLAFAVTVVAFLALRLAAGDSRFFL